MFNWENFSFENRNVASEEILRGKIFGKNVKEKEISFSLEKFHLAQDLGNITQDSNI